MARWLLVMAVVAYATPAIAGLVWYAPPGCPDEHALRLAIARRLEQPLERVVLSIDVRVEEADAGFVAHIDVHGAVEDTRTLTSVSCADLTDAAAIVIARLATEARASVRSRPLPPLPIPHATERWDAGGKLAGVIGTGRAPDLGEAIELGAWAARGPFELELGGQRWRSGRAYLDTTQSAGVELALTLAVMRAGIRLRGPMRVWAALEIGSLGGTGFGVAAARSPSERWLATGAGFGLATPLSAHVRAIAGLETDVVLDRVQFMVDTGAALYRAPPVTARLGLGIEVGWR
jgi:hypothetical protein